MSKIYGIEMNGELQGFGEKVETYYNNSSSFGDSLETYIEKTQTLPMLHADILGITRQSTISYLEFLNALHTAFSKVHFAGHLKMLKFSWDDSRSFYITLGEQNLWVNACMMLGNFESLDTSWSSSTFLFIQNGLGLLQDFKLCSIIRSSGTTMSYSVKSIPTV